MMIGEIRSRNNIDSVLRLAIHFSLSLCLCLVFKNTIHVVNHSVGVRKHAEIESNKMSAEKMVSFVLENPRWAHTHTHTVQEAI